MSPARNSDLENEIAHKIKSDLRPKIKIFCFDEVASVLDEAKQINNLNSDECALILARKQKAGRGQQGRSWQSNEGDFLGCYLFNTCCLAAQQLPAYSLVTALQVAQVLISFGLVLGVKWPNDVLSAKDLKKISGVLLEADFIAASSQNSNQKNEVKLRVGIGVNLKSSPVYATSTKDQLGIELELSEFSAKLSVKIYEAFQVYQNKFFDAFISDWQELDLYHRKLVNFQTVEETFQAEALGVDKLGRLLLKRGQQVKEFSSGRILSSFAT